MKVFFVVGAARSGTTLLTRLLSAHERVHLHHERRVLEIAGAAGALLRTGGRPVERHPDPATLRSDLVRGRRVADAVLRAGAAPGTSWFGDKYPPYAGQIPLLAEAWPEARFLHIVRDGRGVVASWLRTWPRDHAWRRGHRVPPISEIAHQWAEAVDRADAAGSRLGAERYLAIRYEDLLASPQAVGGRMLALLGETPTPAFTEALDQVRTKGDWRRDLSPAEVAAVESTPAARQALARWGWSLEAEAAPDPDTADHWSRVAREAVDEDAARLAWLRVLRLDPGHPGAVSWLMETQAHRGESLFALMNLAPGRIPDAARATAALLARRGLDPAVATALAGASP